MSAHPVTRMGAIVAMSSALLLFACGAPAPVKKAPPPPTDVGPSDPWGPRPAVPAVQGGGFPTPERIVVSGKGRPSAQRPGVELLVVERHDAPAVFLRWVLPGGRAVAFTGARGKSATRWPEGTLDFTARMLTEGTRRHRSSAFAAALERHGGTLDVDVGPDAIVVSGRVLSHQLEPYLKLIREALTEPELAARAAKSLRQRYTAALTNVQRQPKQVAGRNIGRLLHGSSHPYGSPGLTLDSVGKVGASDMRAALRAAFRLGGSTLVVVGDVKGSDLATRLRKVFGRALDSTPAAVDLPSAGTLELAGCQVIDIPDAVQTAIIEANPGPSAAIAGRADLVIANQVLGGSASSRLFTVLRERKGLTYGIYSALDLRRRTGDWSVSTSVRTAKTAAALAAIRTEIRLMRSAAAGAKELGAARQYLAGQFVLRQSSGRNLAYKLAQLRTDGLPDDTWQRHVAALQGVDAERARAAASTWMGSGRRITMLAGSVSGMRPAIDALCTRMVQRDAQGRLLRYLIADDNEMGDADRVALFALWSASEPGLVPLARYVANAKRSAGFRADALMTLLGTPRQDKILATGAAASDWPKVAGELSLRLVAALSGGEAARARSARVVLLDLIAPASGSSPLREAGQTAAHGALAGWAFAGITPEGETADVAKIMKERLVEADLARLGPQAVDGLEALISTDVWRTSAARALVARGEGSATRALVRAYRRSLVERKALPNPEDLALIGATANHQTALLLLDAHAVHQASEKPAVRQSVANTMATLRSVIDRMASATSREPSDRRATRTVLERDFGHLLRPLERVLAFRNGDDRWWAAELIIRNLGVKGLRLALDGLADDEVYAAEGWHAIDPRRSMGDLCRNEIAPLGGDAVRTAMLARIHRQSRIGKAIAVTCLKALGDAGSMDALRTTHDKTDVGPVLGLVGVVTVSQLARSAVAVRQYMAQVDAAIAAGQIDRKTGVLYKNIAYYTVDKSGEQLKHEVARQAPPPPRPKATKKTRKKKKRRRKAPAKGDDS